MLLVKEKIVFIRILDFRYLLLWSRLPNLIKIFLWKIKRLFVPLLSLSPNIFWCKQTRYWPKQKSDVCGQIQQSKRFLRNERCAVFPGYSLKSARNHLVFSRSKSAKSIVKQTEQALTLLKSDWIGMSQSCFLSLEEESGLATLEFIKHAYFLIVWIYFEIINDKI